VTRQEFILSEKRNARRVVLPGFAVLVVAVSLAFFWMFVQLFNPDVALAVRAMGLTACVGVLAFAVWFVYGPLARVERRNQHWCPNCKKRFGGTEKMVLSSGKCYYCGFQVIDNVA
jgi:DNA-directed RNA polymerase subunit RPC12/RpoP